jgi:hypothetical protein
LGRRHDEVAVVHVDALPDHIVGDVVLLLLHGGTHVGLVEKAHVLLRAVRESHDQHEHSSLLLGLMALNFSHNAPAGRG